MTDFQTPDLLLLDGKTYMLRKPKTLFDPEKYGLVIKKLKDTTFPGARDYHCTYRITDGILILDIFSTEKSLVYRGIRQYFIQSQPTINGVKPVKFEDPGPDDPLLYQDIGLKIDYSGYATIVEYDPSQQDFDDSGSERTLEFKNGILL